MDGVPKVLPNNEGVVVTVVPKNPVPKPVVPVPPKPVVPVPPKPVVPGTEPKRLGAEVVVGWPNNAAWAELLPNKLGVDVVAVAP